MGILRILESGKELEESQMGEQNISSSSVQYTGAGERKGFTRQVHIKKAAA